MKKPLQVGVQLPVWDYHVHDEISFDILRSMAVEGERLGFDYATVDDHLARGRDGRFFESWTTITALAAITSRLRFVPIVLSNLYRHPGVLGKMAATLDAITGGRIELGLGAGWKEEEATAFGIPWVGTRERIERLGEAAALIKTLWTQPVATFSGKYYSLRQAVCNPRPVQSPHPPIWIGGGGERRTLRVVAKHADVAAFASPGIGGKNETDMSELEYFRHKRAVLHKHCQEVGRDPGKIALSAGVSIVLWGRDEAAVRRRFKAEVSEEMSEGERARFTSSMRGGVRDPEECFVLLKAYVDEGAGYLRISRCSIEGMRLFAREVMPRIRAYAAAI